MELPRGMKDFDGDETAKIEHIREKFKKLSDVYGFSFMDPSPVELLSVLETKSGPAIGDEIYHFKDKGDREIALRFDFTVGMTRYITAQKSMRLPAKISGFGGVFRYDEPQKGRYRYFHQWDLEIYGRYTVSSDAEIIEATSRLFDSLGLQNITIDINHRSLVESYIKKVFGQCGPKTTADILRAIDKTQKKSAESITEEFAAKGYDVEKLQDIIRFSQITGTIQEIESSFDTAQLESWGQLKELLESLNARGIRNVRVNFGIVRGLDYYSGMVFEVFETGSQLGALAGGGRYDSLTVAFGRDDMGAAGVAGGVERIALTMDKQGAWPDPLQDATSILYIDAETQKTAVRIASAFRAHGIRTFMDLAGRPLKKQMEAASASRYAIIVAPRELESGKIIVRDMRNGAETLAAVDDVMRDPARVSS